MFARVTLLEIDTLRISIDEALELFSDSIVPAMQQQAGYGGAYLLSTPEGRGLLMTLWESEEAANAGLASGYYDEQIGKFVAFYRSPPGREHYEVLFTDLAVADRA